MSAREFCSKHRTKLVGLAQVTTGAVAANLSYLSNAIKPIHYGWGMMVCGVTTMVLGYVNDWLRDEK